MSYHKDPEVHQALIRLLDALCTHERCTDRKSVLLLIPHSADETVIIAQDGKPLPDRFYREAAKIVERALIARGDIKK